MNAYSAAFIKYVKEHPLKYMDVDVDSLMEMFYVCYSEEFFRETESMKAGFAELDARLEQLSWEESDAVFTVVCRLCAEKQKLAFLEGFRAGGQWFMEIRG